MSELIRPTFCTVDPEAITAENVNIYESIVGKTLYPAQPERLFIDVISYREALLRQAIQEAAEQNLVAYARGAALDQLGHNVGVARLDAQPATCTVTLTLDVPAPVSTAIPAGIKLITTDRKFTFTTSEPCYVAAGATRGSCGARCDSAGADANGYLAGSIILDGITDGVFRAENVTTTKDGAPIEDDDTYRARIPLAMEAFSCAGPQLAYKYWALTAHQSIVDVAVVSPAPGVVNIYPLTANGAPSAELLAQISAAVSSDKRRPLTDCVNVYPPQECRFTIEADLDVYSQADRQAVLAAVNQRLTEYGQNVRSQMGKDIVPSQISALIHVDGVYKVTLKSPELIAVDATSFAVLDSWNINIGAVVYD